MGGDIRLVRSEVGKGSTFEISIDSGPLEGADLAERSKERKDAAQNEGETQPLNGIRVLLVEDSVDSRLLFEQILKGYGADVALAGDGLIGVQMALQGNYDVVLMDIQMPHLDGREATKRLRKSGLTVPIIALTAHATKEEQEKCFAVGMDEYCAKPIGADDLCRVTKQWARVRYS